MVMFNPDDENEFWNSQQDWHIVSWKLHGSSGVHTLVTETELVIHMLVEKKYPLRKEVLMQMLKLKLESAWKNTDSLLKIYGLSMHHGYANEALASPNESVFGKDKSIPLMVDSLPKTLRNLNPLMDGSVPTKHKANIVGIVALKDVAELLRRQSCC
ncbi:hypothetical protein Tco_0872127 [Tanacetum coccineum]